jgi:hypothetical protein
MQAVLCHLLWTELTLLLHCHDNYGRFFVGKKFPKYLYCRNSSMVEQKFRKLQTRVRFPVTAQTFILLFLYNYIHSFAGLYGFLSLVRTNSKGSSL